MPAASTLQKKGGLVSETRRGTWVLGGSLREGAPGSGARMLHGTGPELPDVGPASSPPLAGQHRDGWCSKPSQGLCFWLAHVWHTPEHTYSCLKEHTSGEHHMSQCRQRTSWLSSAIFPRPKPAFLEPSIPFLRGVQNEHTSVGETTPPRAWPGPASNPYAWEDIFMKTKRKLSGLLLNPHNILTKFS